MRDSNLFNARGGDGGALQHPGQWWFRRRGGAKRVHRPAFYHQIITFRLPNGSTVDLLLVITTRQKWEAKMRDDSGWTVIPFLKNWVIVLQLRA